MLTYEEMQYLSAFAEYGTLTEVADLYHISQPTITRAMKKAEDVFGVPLFNRTKNSIELNECGKIAASEVSLLIRQTDQAIARVQAYDRATRTISVGSAAAVELPKLVRAITRAFPDKRITTELGLPDELLPSLENGKYQLVVLPYDPAASEKSSPAKYYSVKIEEENLMFLLPRSHPLAGRKSLTLSELNGENMLLYEDIGFWGKIVREKMPDSKFLVQNERYSMDELIVNSVLPCFVTNLTLTSDPGEIGRVAVPISDPEVNITYYAVCMKEHEKDFSPYF
jgi:DNA-binding transcriptional LysR family regulator